MMLRFARLALLLLPTAILAGWIVQLWIGRVNMPVMRAAIQGYDPRDLLRGHYLQFRLTIPGPTGASNGKAVCACLAENPEDGLRPTLTPAACVPIPDRAACRYFIRNPWRSFRYYTTEKRALELEKQLRAAPDSASIAMHFHGDGTVSFSDVATGEVNPR